jgi:hypothetical protein
VIVLAAELLLNAELENRRPTTRRIETPQILVDLTWPISSLRRPDERGMVSQTHVGR